MDRLELMIGDYVLGLLLLLIIIFLFLLLVYIVMYLVKRIQERG